MTTSPSRPRPVIPAMSVRAGSMSLESTDRWHRRGAHFAAWLLGEWQSHVHAEQAAAALDPSACEATALSVAPLRLNPPTPSVRRTA